MDFNKLKLPLAVSGIALLLTVFVVGCDDSFSRRLANSVDSCIDEASKPDVFLPHFWRSERTLHLLQTTTPATIKANGIISYARINNAPNERGLVLFEIEYLSNDPNVREVVFMKGEELIHSMPPPQRKWNKLVENNLVVFMEGGGWEEPDYPYPFEGYRVEDLSVKLVKDDGSVIGPVRVLSNENLWEEIRSKMLTDKKWQDKFPWLYARLLEDPSMPPMWRNPDEDPGRITIRDR